MIIIIIIIIKWNPIFSWFLWFSCDFTWLSRFSWFSNEIPRFSWFSWFSFEIIWFQWFSWLSQEIIRFSWFVVFSYRILWFTWIFMIILWNSMNFMNSWFSSGILYFHGFHDSQSESYDFHDFCDCLVELQDFNYFHNSQIYF